MRYLTFVSLLIFLAPSIGSCSEKKEPTTAAAQAPINDKAQQKDLSEAVRLARNNKAEGLLKLFNIANATISAEYAEVARNVIRERFLKNPDLWLKTYASVKSDDMERYLQSTGVATFVYSSELSQEARTHIIQRLKYHSQIKSTSNLANYILQLNKIKN